tara:strand:+ start:327 stop:1547 length:1221 start_codon:yes stop_codon:yes gene_type:complete
MNSDEAIGIIELGNVNLKCVIFKIINDNAKILSTSTTPSYGFHNDTVINLSKASSAIRSCISSAEKKANISLKKISIVFEQPDFLCTKFSKHKKINGSKIYKDDIEFLLKEAKKQLVLNDKKQSIIHIFNYNYIVDGKKFVEEPIGVYADTFTHEITFITIPKNNLKNINQVFIDCDIEIERLISRTFALGVNCLNNKELGFGSAVIDLGFEKTSFGLFKNLAIAHSITIPIGVNHITKDISKVCSLDLKESENIRNDIDFLLEDDQKIFDDQNNLKNTFFINSNYRKISKNLIIKVIKSRLDEILSKLKKQLIVPDFDLNSGVNILIAGEGSKFINIKKYLKNFFGSNLKIVGENSKDEELERNFASCLGAINVIKDGWETEAIPEIGNKSTKKIGFFAKIFKIS